MIAALVVETGIPSSQLLDEPPEILDAIIERLTERGKTRSNPRDEWHRQAQQRLAQL